MVKKNKVEEVLERGLESLDEIWEMLVDEAKGVHCLVFPGLPKRDKPKGKLIATAAEVEKVCTKCKQPVLIDPPVVWEVWKTRRDTVTLKWLAEQLVGRAKSREVEKFDPEIIVVFGDIDSVSGETRGMSGAIESKGSPPESLSVGIGA